MVRMVIDMRDNILEIGKTDMGHYIRRMENVILVVYFLIFNRIGSNLV